MNKNSLFTRGFTLIELLVVIAIIGILAAVVLASLNDARDGGQDASIKQSMGNLRSQAELVYNQDGYTYANVCTNDNITRLLTAAAANRAETTDKVPVTNISTASNGTSVTCHSNISGYAAIAPLNIQNAGADQSWCVDSKGFAGTTSVSALDATGNDIECR